MKEQLVTSLVFLIHDENEAILGDMNVTELAYNPDGVFLYIID